MSKKLNHKSIKTNAYLMKTISNQ